jgi:HEAT repeat protein
MNTNEIVGIGVMILCGVVLVVQILGLLLSIFKKMTTPKVETLKARKDIKGLIKALRYRKDEGVRQAAARALGEIKDPRAVEPLSAALKDERFSVRQAAAEALGKIKDPRAVEPLSAALKDAEGRVRLAAAEALGKIKDPRAVEPLIAALTDKNSDVRAAATEALVKIGAPAVETLIAALKDAEWRGVRQAAAEALGAIGDARAMETLIAALKDKDSDVRQAAAEALGHLGWEPAQDEIAGWYWMAKRDWDKCVALGALAVEPLIAALKDQYSWTRKAAAEALGEIKDRRAVEPLIAALKDQYSWARQAASEALVKIGAPAVEPLIAALKDKDVRASATEALVKIGAPAMEPLIAALKDKDVRKAAAEALDHLGWKPAQDESAGWYWMAKHDWDKCVALGALAVEPLIAALKDENSDVRQAAAKALGKIGDPRAVEPLIAALKDYYSGVRYAAADALGRLGWEPAQDEMAGWYWMAKRDWDKCVALGALAVEPLIAALKDAEWIVREQALGKIGERCGAAHRALGDERSDVRQAAAKALGAIGDARAAKPLIAALKDKDSVRAKPPPKRWSRSGLRNQPWSRSSPRSRMGMACATKPP